MSTPQPAEALRRVVAAAKAGGAAAADLSAVGEFLASGGVFPPAVLRQAELLPRADAAAAPAGPRGRGEAGGGTAAVQQSVPPTVVHYVWGDALGESEPLPVPPVGYSPGEECEVALSGRGEVFSTLHEVHPWRAAHLPWPAAAVCSGWRFFVALRRGGGAVCSWGQKKEVCLGRDGDPLRPAEVRGLPPTDPVVLLEAGSSSVIAVTRGGEAYGWGSNQCGELALPLAVREQSVPQRIAALSGRGLRRLACGEEDGLPFVLAETDAGELLGWGVLPDNEVGERPPQPPQPLQPDAGRLVFPLRCIAAGSALTAAVVDGAGELWCLGCVKFASAGLPAAERVVRAAVGYGSGEHHVFALTAEGCLWEVRWGVPPRSITAAHPEMPLWLLPCRGLGDLVPLIADVCGGKPRLRLFARIAVRLRLPSDPVRAVVTNYVVLQDYVTGPADDPFGWPARPRGEAH